MSETETIGMFKAKKQTHRFSLNQKVWVVENFGNHLWVVFRWRGKGRYVSGIMEKWGKQDFSAVIGSEGIKEVEVDKAFADRLREKFK